MRLKTQLILLPFLFILLVFITFFINYSYTKNQFESIKTIHIQETNEAIKTQVFKCDKLVSSLMDEKEKLFRKIHNEAKELILTNKYSLEQIVSILNRNYPSRNSIELFLINNKNIVYDTTYKADMNLDMSNFIGAIRIVNRVRDNNEVYIQLPSLDVLNKKYRIYSYGKVDDGRVLEVGFFDDNLNSFKQTCLKTDYNSSLIEDVDLYIDYGKYILNTTNPKVNTHLKKEKFFKDFKLTKEEEIVKKVATTKKDITIHRYENDQTYQILYSFLDEYRPTKKLVTKTVVNITPYKKSLEKLEKYFIFTIIVSILFTIVFLVIFKKRFLNPFSKLHESIEESKIIEDKELLEKNDELSVLAKIYNKSFQNQQDEFEIIFNSITDGIAILNKDNKIVQSNSSFSKITKYDKEELLGMYCFDLFKDKDAASKCVSKVSQSDGLVKSQKEYLTKEKEVITVDVTATTIPNSENILITIKDITLQKRMESDLLNVQNKYGLMFNNSKDGIVLIDADTLEIVEFNKTAYEELGYKKEEFENISLKSILSNEELGRLDRRVGKFQFTNEQTFIAKHKMKDGSILDVEVVASLIDIEDKNYIYANFHNIEHLKFLERQNRLASMGEMIDSIAHQWLQPLGIIKLRTEVLNMGLETKTLDDKLVEETVSNVNSQIEHLTTTINEFRSFFRPSINMQTISLKSLIESSVVLTKDELKKNDIKIEILGDIEEKVNINSNEFKHVLINMINNSKDAFIQNSIENRKITFNVQRLENTIKFSICDNAGGIPGNILSKIFKAHFTTKGKDKGTGMGLYLSKQILDKNDAKIEAENIDKGICFGIYLKAIN